MKDRTTAALAFAVDIRIGAPGLRVRVLCWNCGKSWSERRMINATGKILM